MLVLAVSCTSSATSESETSSPSSIRGSVAVESTTTISFSVSSTVSTFPPVSQVDDEGWLRVPHDEGGLGGSADQLVTGLAAGPSRLVAVGSELGAADVPKAITWVSSDGLSWTRVEQSILDAEMRDVVWYAAADVFVAVGHQESDGAVWTSPDGSSWTRVALFPFANPAGGVEVESVVAEGSGLMAVGREWFGEGESIPAVWTSLDGETWDRASVDVTDTDQGIENGMVDVVGYEGGLLAIGFVGVSTSSSQPAIWQSIDGAAWRRIDLVGSDANDSTLNAIAAAGGSIVMVGESDAEHVDSRAWVSEDLGQSWTRIEVETGPVGIPDLKDVTRTEWGWVAVGDDSATRHEYQELIAAVWYKEDSSKWIRYSPRDDQLLPQEPAGVVGMTTVATFNGAVVAGGADGTDCEMAQFSACDLDAAFWIWRPGG